MRKDFRKPNLKREDNDKHKINEKITAREVRIVFEGQEPQVMKTSEAIQLAEEQELDLEINPFLLYILNMLIIHLMQKRVFLYALIIQQKKRIY